MSISQKQKKSFVIITLVLVIIALFLLIVQLVIGNFLQDRLENSLLDRESSNYNIDVGRVKVNLFTMTLILKDISVEPDSLFIKNIKTGRTEQKLAYSIKIPVIRIRNIGLIDFVTSKYVAVQNFIVKDADIVFYSFDKGTVSKPKKKDESVELFNIDSIVLPGISGININRFSFINFNYSIVKITNNDTISSANKLDFILKDIGLVKNESDSVSFRLVLKDLDLNLSNERFELPGGKYLLSLGNLSFNMAKGLVVFRNFELKPLYSRSKMVSMSKFQYEIYNIEIEKIEIHSFYPENLIRDSKIIMSNVLVNKMKVSIFKDKRRPFDEEKRPKLPQELLKSLKQELFIDSLIVSESELVYSERHTKMEEPMVVNLSKLNATVSNITSISDSIESGTIMLVKLRANLQESIPMGVNIYFPMNSVADTFAFNGWLGKGNMQLFNKILLPAIGIKFDDGYIDGLKFKANANPTYSIGEMTMLYHDLDGVVVRRDMEETNKFMSWVANAAMIKNNPIPNKEERTEPMFFNRVIYKGLGNYLWKTLQSGITATLIPTMDKKVQNEIYSAKGLDKKEIKRKEREEKRRKRKK